MNIRLGSLNRAVHRRVVSKVHQRPIAVRSGSSFISFTFDDFPRSAYSVGRPILEEFGIRGTYYVALGLTGTKGNLGHLFHREDLEYLVDAGHEVGSHTFSHISSLNISTSDFLSDVERGISQLEYLRPNNRPRNFAYPFGDVTMKVKKAIGAVVASARGIIPGLNGPQADLNLLRANRLYGGLEGRHRLERLIVENEVTNRWLIFYTHDVCPNPSPYGCTPDLLRATLSFAAQRNTKILTVARALEEFGAA